MDLSIPDNGVEGYARVLGGEVGLDLEEWRTAEQLTYEDLAERLDCSLTHARRYALGECLPDSRVLNRILEITGGRVGLYALHRRRMQFLRERGLWSADGARASVEALTKAS